MPRPKGKKMPVRFSVGLDVASHAKLSRLADRHGVSLAWMVRRAVAEFIERQEESDQAELPLRLGGEGEQTGSA